MMIMVGGDGDDNDAGNNKNKTKKKKKKQQQPSIYTQVFKWLLSFRSSYQNLASSIMSCSPPTLHNKMMSTTYGVLDNYDTFPYAVLSNLLLLSPLKYKYSPQYPAPRNPKSMFRVKKPPHKHTKL